MIDGLSQPPNERRTKDESVRDRLDRGRVTSNRPVPTLLVGLTNHLSGRVCPSFHVANGSFLLPMGACFAGAIADGSSSDLRSPLHPREADAPPPAWPVCRERVSFCERLDEKGPSVLLFPVTSALSSVLRGGMIALLGSPRSPGQAVLPLDRTNGNNNSLLIYTDF